MTNEVFAPHPDDLRLLRAVLTDEGFAENWPRWQARVDIDGLSPAAHHLLPALYKRAEEHAIDHPWVARFRGVYRRQWTASQVHRIAGDSLAATLELAGVPHLTPGDQSLAAISDSPARIGLRRARVAVRWTDAPLALDALTAEGWSVARSSPPWALRRRITATEWHLTHAEVGTATLTNFFNPWVRDHERDADVWERAAPPTPSIDDLFAFALLTDLHERSALVWALGCLDLLQSHGSELDVSRILDRPALRSGLVLAAARMTFLTDVGGADAGRIAEEIGAVARRHRPAATAAGRLGERVRRSLLATARKPVSASDLRRRVGDPAGAWRFLRHG